MKQIKLGDYIDILTDYHSGGSYKTLKEKTKILYEPSYAVMIRTLNFEGDDFTNDLIYCDKNSYDFLAYAHIHEDDVLMNKIANPGSVYIMPKVDYKTACGMNLFLIRFKNINQRYMYYVMKNNEAYIKSQTHGTTTKTITKDEVRDLVFFIHETPEEQNRVEQLLTTIDYKISNNKRAINILNNISKLLYDYWFVQFDFPDENGKPYKSSGGKMVWNEELKREIPYGWKVSTLRKKYRIERGISYSSKDIESGQGMPMINLACIDTKRNYRDGELKYYDGNISNDDLLSPFDLLIACTDLTRNADIVGSPILTPNDGKTYTFSTDIAKLIPNETELNPIYLYMALRTEYYHNYIKKWASGTNVLHLDLTGLDWYKMWFPPKSLQDKFAETILLFENKKFKIMIENRELTSLRDFLLPMLMNGQVKVKKGENK